MMTTTTAAEGDTSHANATVTANTTHPISILVVGATGRIGQAVVQAAARSTSSPSVHAFIRSPESFMAPYRFYCNSIHKGDARSPYELANAIESTRADHVVLCVGAGNNEDDIDVCEASAISIAGALCDTERYGRIRVTIFSMSIFPMMKPFLGYDVLDHLHQEESLISSFQEWGCLEYLLIVRMKKTPIIIDDSKRKHCVNVRKISNFRKIAGNRVFLPMSSVHRDDMAEWLIEHICGPSNNFGGIYGISGSRKLK